MGDDIEVQLKEWRKQVEEDGESRIAYEEARTAESKAAEQKAADRAAEQTKQFCLLYTSPSPRDRQKSRMPSSA